MELSKIQTADLSEWKATELADQLAVMAGEGKPADMSQDEYNSIVRKVVEAYNAARKKETNIVKGTEQEAVAEEPKEETISEEEFARNAMSLNKYEAQTVAGDEFKSVFDRIDVVNAKGKSHGINLANEVVEAAKLGVAADSVTDKEPLQQEEYNERLRTEVANILSTMILTKPADEKSKNDVENANDRAKELANVFDPNYKGKVKVRDDVASATFSTYMGNVATKLQDMAPKYNKGKNKGFFSRITEKYNNLDAVLTKKLKQGYEKSKAVVTKMIENGTWKEAAAGAVFGGVAFMAAGTAVGVAATVGLTGLTAWQTYKRGIEFWKGFKAAKAENKKVTFGKYTKDNWKDAAKIVLYAGATVAGGYAVYHNALAVATKGASDIATTASAVAAKEATLTKGGLLWGANSGVYIADATAAAAKGDWKEAKSSVGKAALGTAGLALAYFLSSDNSAHAAEPTHAAGHGPVDMDKAFAKGLFDANGNPQGDWLDTGSNQEAANVVADMDAAHYAVESAGPKEMAIYIRNLKLVPDSDIMVDNIKGGLIKIPDGMSPEEAVNIARIQQLNYGNSEILHALKDCDGTEYDLRAVLKNIHDNSWTTVGKGHNLGDLKDFVGDNCRHGIIKQIDCDGNVKVKVINLCKPVVINNDVVIEPHKPVIKNPDPAPTPIQPETPTKPTDPIDIKEPVKEDGLSNENFRHVEADKDNMSQQAGDKTYKLKSTPATDAEIKSTPAGQVSDVKTSGNGLLLGKDGKPLNISFTHQGR